MRLSCQLVAMVLLSGPVIFAQHSTGGSSNGGGGAGSSGGGSHGGSSGSSSSSSAGGSGGSHSSGGSGSHSSSGHGSGSHSAPSRVTPNGSHLHSDRSSGETNRGMQAKNKAKATPFSFLRRGFRKQKPSQDKPVADLRRPFCWHGSCTVCPAGHGGTGAACGQRIVGIRSYNSCSRQDFSTGGSCFSRVHFLNDCEGLRQQLEQQAQKMQAAREVERNACAGVSQQECSSSMGTRQNEESFYNELQNRYRTCRQQSFRRASSFNSTWPFLP